MKGLFLSITLILTLASLWVAADRTRPTSPPGTIELVWVSDDNPARKEQIQLFDQFAARQGHPEVRCRLDPGNVGMEKVIIQSVGGVGPDLFDVYGKSELTAYAEAGLPEDVTEKLRAAGIGPSILWPSMRQEVMHEGRQCVFPTNCGPFVLFYNKAVFDRAGVPYPQGDWTWDQFLATCRRLTRRRADGRGNETYGAFGLDLHELIWQNGGHVFSPEGIRCVVDSPEAIAAAQWYVDLFAKEHVAPSPAEEAAMATAGGWGQGDLTLFTTGRIAMFRGGRWGLIRYRQIPELRIGICPLPYHRQKAVQLAWRATAVNPRAPHPDLAFLFLRYLASREYCEQINRSADANAPVEKYCRTPLFLHDPLHPEEDYNRLWIDEMAVARSFEQSPFVNPFVSDRILQTHIDAMRNGLETPAGAMRATAAEINAQIARTLRKEPALQARYAAAQARERRMGEEFLQRESAKGAKTRNPMEHEEHEGGTKNTGKTMRRASEPVGPRFPVRLNFVAFVSSCSDLFAFSPLSRFRAERSLSVAVLSTARQGWRRGPAYG
jgi:ABC-type glycerol-3-phosphate transport system substrate-binding protein